jgi:hypothetical protein
MIIPNDERHAGEMHGILGRVDLVCRQVEVCVDGNSICLDVRPDCAITLRCERIKLRMLQPRDHVRVQFTENRGTFVADAIDVQPGSPLSQPRNAMSTNAAADLTRSWCPKKLVKHCAESGQP